MKNPGTPPSITHRNQFKINRSKISNFNLSTEIHSFAHLLYLLFVGVFRGKIADVSKGGRYKTSVVLYSVVANYNLHWYTKTIWKVHTTNSLSQFNKYLVLCNFDIYNFFISWLWYVTTYIVAIFACFLKRTYKYYMPLFSEAYPKLLNFDKIIKKFHVFLGHSIKQMYSSYNDISSGLLI